MLVVTRYDCLVHKASDILRAKKAKTIPAGYKINDTKEIVYCKEHCSFVKGFTVPEDLENINFFAIYLQVSVSVKQANGSSEATTLYLPPLEVCDCPLYRIRDNQVFSKICPVLRSYPINAEYHLSVVNKQYFFSTDGEDVLLISQFLWESSSFLTWAFYKLGYYNVASASHNFFSLIWDSISFCLIWYIFYLFVGELWIATVCFKQVYPPMRKMIRAKKLT